MDGSPSGFSIHGILQAQMLEWVAISSSRGFSWPRDQTHISCISCIAGRFFTTEPVGKPQIKTHQIKKKIIIKKNVKYLTNNYYTGKFWNANILDTLG